MLLTGGQLSSQKVSVNVFLLIENADCSQAKTQLKREVIIQLSK